MTRPVLLTFSFALLLAGVGQVRADIIFSDLGPGDSYKGSFGYVVDSSDAVSTPFTPTVTSVLSEVELAMGTNFGGGNQVIVQLQNDNAGSPGSIIESYSISVLPTFGGSSSDHLSVAFSSLDPTLTAGTQYWLSVLPAVPSTLVNWNVNSTGYTGLALSSDGGATWNFSSSRVEPAFRVDSAPVPEPSSLVL